VTRRQGSSFKIQILQTVFLEAWMSRRNYI
jgi:hypothetical protein